MRLWHYKLIPALDNKHLIAQWRECIAIKRQWEKGTLKHPLVLYVTKHNKRLFMYYVSEVALEMDYRGIKYKGIYLKEIASFCECNEVISNVEVYPEHDDRYLRQCYYNLQEKYDKGIINETTFNQIRKVVDIDV